MSTTKKIFIATDRLTRACDSMLDAFRNHAERAEGDRAIVFLVDGGKRGGIGISGYEDDKDALVDLFVHLRAMFRAQGSDLEFIPVGTTPPKDRA